MRSRRLMALVMLAMLTCARPADAGWLDFIWEMTGPRMIGFGIDCEVAIARDPATACVTPFGRFPRPGTARLREGFDPRFWISTEAFYYRSKNSEAFSSSKGVNGFGVDPMLVFSRIKDMKYPSKSIRFTAAAGLTLQRFWSEDFEAFGNSGFKFRPLSVEVPFIQDTRLNFAYNLRYYWDGYEATSAVEGTQRIPAAFIKVDRSETVHGFTVALIF